MIVRILGDAQYDFPEEAVASLDPLDNALQAAIDADDKAAFQTALCNLLATVRSEGKPVASDSIIPSELTLPHDDATLEEVRALLASEPEVIAGDEGV
jgi:hypothetical protein